MGGVEKKVDVLTTICLETQKLLTAGEIKSTDLVNF